MDVIVYWNSRSRLSSVKSTEEADLANLHAAKALISDVAVFSGGFLRRSLLMEVAATLLLHVFLGGPFFAYMRYFFCGTVCKF